MAFAITLFALRAVHANLSICILQCCTYVVSFIIERTLQVTVRPMLRDRCPVSALCNVDVLWPNGWMHQDATWYRGRPCLLLAKRSPSQQLLSSCYIVLHEIIATRPAFTHSHNAWYDHTRHDETFSCTHINATSAQQ